MLNVSKILEDLNSVIDGGTRKPRAVGGEMIFESTDAFTGEWTNNTTRLFLASIMADENVKKHDSALVDEMLESMLDHSLAEEAPELVIWSDPDNPSKGATDVSGVVGVKKDVNQAMGMILLRHPPVAVLAGGTVGKELWGEAIGKVMNTGKILGVRYRKTDGAVIIEPNFGAVMHWYKKFLNDIGFTLTDVAEKRLVDQLEDQIVGAAKDLAAASGMVSDEHKSRAGRLLASTKGRKSYKGKKAV